MSLRRGVCLYAVLLAMFAIVLCRCYVIAHNHSYAKKAQDQTVTTLLLSATRGNFYDCNGEQLTGTEQVYYALCVPGEKSYAMLFDQVDYASQSLLYKKRNAAAPFLIAVARDLTDQGIYTVTGTRRYAACSICPHLIGYLDGSGHGVSGLEAALDERLYSPGTAAYVQCTTNAQGGLMEDTQPRYCAASGQGEDVQLTIDAAVQRACEGIAQCMMTTGCVLVMDVPTASVRGCVSVPSYDPENVQASISAQDTALLNRAFSAYAVGSVFKPVLAAAALESDCADLTYSCGGYTTVNGHIYRCAGGVPHGAVDLAAALEKSCNCYFITLGAQLGPEALHRYASAFGFGQPVYLTGGLKAAAGNLPDAQRLADLGQQANFSFGQGALLATPVQVAAMMNTIANDGVYQMPAFVERTFSACDGLTMDNLRQQQSTRVLGSKNAALLAQMLAGVVSDGLGHEAQPTWETAAGKTGTAQTGRFNAEGQEYKNLWFAGFYPAQSPQYTIVVMQDDQTDAANSSAAVFSRVCDALALLGKTGTNLAVRTAKSS